MGGKSTGWKVLSAVDCAMVRTVSFLPLEANECEVEIRKPGFAMYQLLVCHGLDP